MPPKRLVKDPVPPPGPMDVYLDRYAPEATTASDIRVRENPELFLRLTPADQRFLKRFGIRVP